MYHLFNGDVSACPNFSLCMHIYSGLLESGLCLLLRSIRFKLISKFDLRLHASFCMKAFTLSKIIEINISGAEISSNLIENHIKSKIELHQPMLHTQRSNYLLLDLVVVLDESGKFLLAAKRSRRTMHTDYNISMDSKIFSRSSSGYIGKLRSNFLGTKFIIYDTQPPYYAGRLCSQEQASCRFSSRKVSPKVPTGSYPIAQVNYELNVLGTRGPRRMQCTMHSIPASAVEPDGVVPGQPKELLPRLFEESFRSTATSLSKYSLADSSMDLSSCRFSEFGAGTLQDGDDADKERPMVLRNKAPRWHEQLQCWCLNFRGRVTVASVKNFQLIASAPQPASEGASVASHQPAPPAQMQPQSSQPSSSSSSSSHDTVILQFGKVAKDTFTMDYRYPLSAFQAFAICLTSFDTKLACE